MISRFYRKYGMALLWLVVISFPYLVIESERLKSNNDVETWLPKGTDVRASYDRFRRDFGVDDAVVVGIDSQIADDKLVEALALRLEELDGIDKCWTPARLMSRMQELGVGEEDARKRLQGLVLSDSGQMTGMIAVLTPAGAKNRLKAINEVREQVAYCQLDGDQVALAGSPVIVTELDRLGSPESSRRFFFITLGISLLMLYYFLRHWGLSLALLVVSAWGIYFTKTLILLVGLEMNFIMGALSVMVLISGLSIAIHFLSYYTSARDANAADPLGTALRESWNPCFLSTLTTLIGLMSLNVSTILPVSQFGTASAVGSVVALLTGLGIAPALVVVWPDCTIRSTRESFDFTHWGGWINNNRKQVLAGAVVLLCVTGIGIVRLESHIDALEFLPETSKVRNDALRIERELTSIDSVEAIVNFESQDIPFAQRLDKVREIEAKMRQHPAIRHTLSAATFFPAQLPESPVELAQLFNTARASGGNDGYLADNYRLWRISARIRRDNEVSSAQVYSDLSASLAGQPVTFTGVAPLLENAQREIFTGFWQSFTAAFLSITLVMILSLRSVVAGLIAMVPNIIPIWIVFGIIGYCGMTVDIGMMMTGSISLGISVDCTFHFLVTYQERFKAGDTSAQAALAAIKHTGEPLLGSTVVSALGMLALCLCSFVPTARFGYLMAAQMVASLGGELLTLPAILCMRPERRKKKMDPPASEPTSASPPPPPHIIRSPKWSGTRRPANKSSAARSGVL